MHRESFGRDVEQRRELVEALFAGVGVLPWTGDALPLVGALAESTGLSFYDAVFLDAALRSEGGPLVTQDTKLLAIARKKLGTKRALDLDGLVLATANAPELGVAVPSPQRLSARRALKRAPR